MDNFNLREYLYNNPLLNEEKSETPQLKKGDVKVIDFILGDEDVNEANFNKIRDKFNKALKKGAMSLGILAAVLGSPNMSQAQKAQLKKDVTDSTWFLDYSKDFKNNPISYSSDGRSYTNPDFQQDLKEKRDASAEKYLKDKAGRFGRSDDPQKWADEVGTNVYHMEKWVNNLGQDSTVYKQYKDTKYDSEKGGEFGAVVYTDLSEPVKTIVNKDDIKAWAGDGWSEITKKGNVANWYWTEDGKTSIRPWQWKGLQKVEKLTKAGKTDKLEKLTLKDKGISSGKRLMDKGFKSSDFYKVDLDQIDSPPEK